MKFEFPLVKISIIYGAKSKILQTILNNNKGTHKNNVFICMIQLTLLLTDDLLMDNHHTLYTK